MTREAFEAWAGKWGELERIPTGAPFAGEYQSIVTQARWDAWKASHDAALERAAVVLDANAANCGGLSRMILESNAQAIRALKESKE